MSSIVARTAFKATRALRRPSGVNAGEPGSLLAKLTHSDRTEGERALREGARKDPELYVLYFITAATLAGTGYWFPHFVQTLFGETEPDVPIVEDSEPWKRNGGKGKYQYYPGGDPRRGVKDAPSALHSVVVQDVNLPRKRPELVEGPFDSPTRVVFVRLHEQFNKLGKPEWDV